MNGARIALACDLRAEWRAVESRPPAAAMRSTGFAVPRNLDAASPMVSGDEIATVSDALHSAESVARRRFRAGTAAISPARRRCVHVRFIASIKARFKLYAHKYAARSLIGTGKAAPEIASSGAQLGRP